MDSEGLLQKLLGSKYIQGHQSSLVRCASETKLWSLYPAFWFLMLVVDKTILRETRQ